MERVLPLLTGAVLLAAVAGCSAGADHATVPPAAEQELSGGGSTPGAASAGGGSGRSVRSSPRAADVTPPSTPDTPTGTAKARIVAGGGTLGQSGHGSYVCRLIGAPAVGLSSAEGSMSGSGGALAVDASESGTTVLDLPAGENNLATYCTDPGGVGPIFTGTSAAFVVAEGGSTDVEITAAPQP
ncbi:MAG: hypothetical protein ACQEXN_01205 [Actinomycetota bacterium]